MLVPKGKYRSLMLFRVRGIAMPAYSRDISFSSYGAVPAHACCMRKRIYKKHMIAAYNHCNLGESSTHIFCSRICLTEPCYERGVTDIEKRLAETISFVSILSKTNDWKRSTVVLIAGQDTALLHPCIRLIVMERIVHCITTQTSEPPYKL